MKRNTRTSLAGLVAAIVALAAADADATTRTVSNLNDSGANSLRDTIAASAANDTINFSVTGTITLTSGEITIGTVLTMIGPAAGLTVSGNGASRVFRITAGTVTILNLTISNGRAIGADGANGTALHPNGFPGGDGQGGGVFNSGTLVMTNCTFAGNSALGGKGGNALGSAGDGGAGGTGAGAALYNQGTLTLVNCTFSGNVSTGGAGGGLGLTSGTGGNADGGCIFNHATLTLVNCTGSANSAAGGNGGSGGGDGGNGGDGRGGGLFHDAAGSSMVQNTIIAGNSATGGTGGIGDATDGTDGSGFGSDVFSSGAVASQGYNLIGNTSGSSGFGATGDQLNVDPKLSPLADNGGPTKTIALRVGSPAIDKGKSFGLATDQRGQPRYDNPNIVNATGGDGADIGAYEATELRIVNAQKTGNHLRLDFINWLGTNYEVQSRSDLKTGSWGSLAGSMPGNGGIASTTVSNAFGVPKQFYRIHPVP